MGVSWTPSVEEMARRPVAEQIEREFSGVVAWYGRFTRAWWAVVPGHRVVWLVEASDPRALREVIMNARGR